jgi:probable addiction module antidote protein
MQAPTFLSRSCSSQVSNSAALVAERQAVDAKTKEDVAVYRRGSCERRSGQAALNTVTRAKGVTEVAKQVGLGQASLYKALSPTGNPEFVRHQSPQDAWAQTFPCDPNHRPPRSRQRAL